MCSFTVHINYIQWLFFQYFYSIKDISIGGRCRCNGHADVCVSRADDPYKLKCECQHRTCGDNCEKCCENKVQKKWRQSKANMLFECEGIVTVLFFYFKRLNNVRVPMYKFKKKNH